MNWSGLRIRPMPCPECGAPWKLTEILGEAHRGAGYRLKCAGCDHEWDDRLASHHERARARRRPPITHRPPMTWVDMLEHPER